jgi:cytochrome b
MDKNKVVLWPLWLRGLHWLIAIIIILNAFVLEDGDPPHRYLGYVAFAAVLIRFLMGFIGIGVVSFKHFPLGLSNIKHFLSTHFKKTHSYEGHNPLASWVYIVIWILVLLLGVTGWMLGLDYFFGDETIEDIHSLFSDALIVLVIIHLIGIGIDAILYKRKTWMGMINGYKK